ncbi:MAG: VOC family protein [Oscillochloris sp.]|nr:VOC family protein [Oscillochloris sp.]
MESYTIPAATGVGLVELTIIDSARSLRFYHDLLGLTVEQIAAAPRTYLLGTAERPLLQLVEQPAAPARPPRTTGLYHVALLLPTRRDLARVLRRLAEAQYPLSGVADHLVSEALYLDDPDGNGLEIYADRPREAWPRAGDEVRMTVDPLDLDGLLAELDSEPWAGIPAATIVGHIHLNVADLRSSEAFYGSLLGFDVMQRFSHSALFVAAGGYHHHLGLNVWNGIGAPPPPGAVGLHCYSLELPDRATRDALFARLVAAGIAMSDADEPTVVDPSGIKIKVAIRAL